MRKTRIIVFILILLSLVILPLKINAATINPEKYKPSELNSADIEDMYQFGGSVAGVIQIIGTIVSAGTLIIIGIRYVVASVEEKAEYKERMIPYVIGVVLLFGATNIVGIIDKIMGNNANVEIVEKEHKEITDYEYKLGQIFCLDCGEYTESKKR